MKLNLTDFWQYYLTVRADDKDLVRRNRTLLMVLSLVIVANILSGLQVLIFTRDVVQSVIVAGALFMFLVLIGFTRRGYGWPPYVFLLILISLIMVTVDDADSLMGLAFVLPVVLAPLVAESWLAIPMTGISMVGMYMRNYLAGGETLGFLPMVLMGILGGAAWLASWNVEQSLHTVERTAEALQTTNQSLQSGRILLEQRTAELERRARYLQATADVSREVASELAIEELLDRVVRLVIQRFNVYHVGIFLLDEGRESVVLQAVSSLKDPRFLARGYWVKVGDASTVGYVTQSGAPRVLPDVDALAEDGEIFVPFIKELGLSDTRSVMTLPLHAQGEMLGALEVHSTEANAFVDEDAAVLQALADQVALAIHNARLFEQLERSLDIQRQLYGDMSRDAWVKFLQAQSDLAYRSTERGVFKLTDVENVLTPEAVVEQAFTSGELVAGEPLEDGHVPLAIPVRSPSGDIIGVIDTYKSAVYGAWTPDEEALLQDVADRLGSALESAQFYYEIQQRAAREQLTREITARIRRSLEVDMVAQQAVRELQSVLQARSVTVRLGTTEQLLAVQASAEDETV